ncbi:MAG: hypothetical protein RL037_1443 [Bacteroidota bacterium]|jgi:hypothetical protein
MSHNDDFLAFNRILESLRAAWEGEISPRCMKVTLRSKLSVLKMNMPEVFKQFIKVVQP